MLSMRGFCASLALICYFLAGPASACRQALMLALDVSGSVNAVEYQQQVTGLAIALDHPEIREAILSNTEQPVVIAAFEWSSANHQYIILPWTRLDSAAALDGAIAQIRRHRKVRAGLKTAMGTALKFAQAMINQQAACWVHTIDVSGDGRNNFGPAPKDIYAGGFGRTSVNALVVGNPRNESGEGRGITPNALRAYFEREVILGPGAFAMVANGYADYARAMQRKLAKELEPPVIGSLQVPLGAPG